MGEYTFKKLYYAEKIDEVFRILQDIKAMYSDYWNEFDRDIGVQAYNYADKADYPLYQLSDWIRNHSE